VALRRAKHLAIDLVLEQVESDDVSEGLAELATKNVLNAALVERLAREFTSEHDPARELDGAEVLALGGDLDRCYAASSTKPRCPSSRSWRSRGSTCRPRSPASHSRSPVATYG
jgi:hypothetical protein